MVFQHNSRTKWNWYLRIGCYNLRECWGRHFPFFARIWLTPQFEDKVSSSFFSREKWMQLDARLALVPSCQASLFTVYGRHLFNSWGSREGGANRLSVIRVEFGESIALCFFMFSKAKWVLPTPGNSQSSVMTLASHYASIHLLLHRISEWLSMPTGEEWKESIQVGRWRENISGNAYIPTFDMTWQISFLQVTKSPQRWLGLCHT